MEMTLTSPISRQSASLPGPLGGQRWTDANVSLLRYQVKFDDGLDNTIVVDGVPIIDRSKLEKLLAKIAKEFSRKGISVKPDDMFLPWDSQTGKSKGCGSLLNQST